MQIILENMQFLLHWVCWNRCGTGTRYILVCPSNIRMFMAMPFQHDDEQTVPGPSRRASVNYGPSVIWHWRNDTAERALALLHHKAKPADNWGTGRCHGNRGSSRVTLESRRGMDNGATGGKCWVESAKRKPQSMTTPRCEYARLLGSDAGQW